MSTAETNLAPTIAARLGYIRPLLPEPRAWLPYLSAAYQARHFTNFGPVNARFEQKLGDRFGNGRQAVTTASATAGLTAVLQALGIRGPVAIPSFTFVATAQAVLAAGCRPVLCESSTESWELDPRHLSEAIHRSGAKAVIHVRSFGLGHDLSPIVEVAAAHGVPLIVDAASALGGQIDGNAHVCGQGTVEVCSLHATKVFAIGEGGVVFAPPELNAAIRRASNFGLQDGDVVAAGANGKLSEFHAAVGLSVLDRIADYVRHRRKVAARYFAALRSLPGVSHCWPAGLAPWQGYPLLCAPHLDLQAILAMANARGVELRRYYYMPLHRTRALAQFADRPLPVTDRLSQAMICLPVYSDMSEQEQQRVLDAVQPALG